MQKLEVITFKPNKFEITQHYYPKVLNANLHQLVKYFLNMGNEKIVERYCHLNPFTCEKSLKKILSYRAEFLPWSGCDLFHVTDESAKRKMIVIETNSCPSGQKSMPLRDEFNDLGGYEVVLKHSFLPYIKEVQEEGVLAVIYDKNFMEASGYAATLAEITKEEVYLIPYFDDSWEQFVELEKITNKLIIKEEKKPIRAAFRYVTQKPWSRVPVKTKTRIFNPIMGCLAGGRNKLLAAQAYEIFNAQMVDTGLKIHIPQTIEGISKREIKFMLRRFGGVGVVKNPYSNAGQGVWTILSDKEYQDFKKVDIEYDSLIFQALIGNSAWSSDGGEGKIYHVGTMPNKKNQIFAADLRFMVCSGPDGYVPVGLYARRAKEPLAKEIPRAQDSWSMLGTNLSIKEGKNIWSSDIDRLVLVDSKDFNFLGIGVDQLIEGYVQTVMASVAIDKMAAELIDNKGEIKTNLFNSMNKDSVLGGEILNV